MFIMDDKDNSNDNRNIYLRKNNIQTRAFFVISVKVKHKGALSHAHVKFII